MNIASRTVRMRPRLKRVAVCQMEAASNSIPVKAQLMWQTASLGLIISLPPGSAFADTVAPPRPLGETPSMARLAEPPAVDVISPGALAALRTARDVIARFHRVAEDEVPALGAAFDRALDEAAIHLRERDIPALRRQETRGLLEKLALIAWDLRKNRARYDELQGRYRGFIGPDKRRPIPPGPTSAFLTSNHTTEEYRLAWEYFLLKPIPRNEFQAQSDARAVEALMRIQNPAAIFTLLQAHRATQDGGLPGEWAKMRQFEVMKILLYLPCEASARALLEMSVYDMEQWRREAAAAPAGKRVWDRTGLQTNIVELTSGRSPGTEGWRAAVSAIDEASLPEAQRLLLQRIKQAQQ